MANVRFWLLSLAALSFFPAIVAGQRDIESDVAFTQPQLDQMLAPIALYPDSLLSQILMASTYPLEVVEAARWSRDHLHLEGEEAVDAVEEKEWDPSVKALVAFPQVLARMDEDLTWTRRLGDAFLVQEEEVMDTIQELRRRADKAGNLGSLDHLEVRRERETIYITPAERRVVYVPYYRTTVIYGSWWWPAYPPVYWTPPPRHYRSARIVWAPGVRVSSRFYFSTCYWPERHVVVVRHGHAHGPRTSTRVTSSRHFDDARRWRHDVVHRRGVAYRHERLRERFGSNRFSSGSSPRHVVREERPETLRHRERSIRRERRLGDLRRSESRTDRPMPRFRQERRDRGEVEIERREARAPTFRPSVRRPTRAEMRRAEIRQRRQTVARRRELRAQPEELRRQRMELQHERAAIRAERRERQEDSQVRRRESRRSQADARRSIIERRSRSAERTRNDGERSRARQPSGSSSESQANRRSRLEDRRATVRRRSGRERTSGSSSSEARRPADRRSRRRSQ